MSKKQKREIWQIAVTAAKKNEKWRLCIMGQDLYDFKCRHRPKCRVRESNEPHA